MRPLDSRIVAGTLLSEAPGAAPLECHGGCGSSREPLPRASRLLGPETTDPKHLRDESPQGTWQSRDETETAQNWPLTPNAREVFALAHRGVRPCVVLRPGNWHVLGLVLRLWHSPQTPLREARLQAAPLCCGSPLGPWCSEDPHCARGLRQGCCVHRKGRRGVHAPDGGVRR